MRSISDRRALKSMLAASLLAGLLASQVLAAQTQSKSAATPAKKPVAASTKSRTAAKAPVRKGPRVQTAPASDRVTEIQQALAREGFYSDGPNGKWDDATTTAMRNFQSAKGLTPTGKLSALSLQKLGLGSETAGKGAPMPMADARPSALTESELNNSGAEIDQPAN
jgi:peptidoglycan hydrolase-like protein with peptidoglycan-binding domain